MKSTEEKLQTYKNEFRIDGLEHLEQVEKELLALEKKADPERITVIFRSIHSIKGAAGFMSYNKIAELSHLMETLLQMKRQENTVPSGKEINALLSGVDCLKQMLENLEQSNKMNISTIAAEISRLVESSGTEKIRKRQDTQVRLINDQGLDFDFNISEFTLESVPSKSEHLYMVQFDLNDLQRKQGIAPHSLIRKLHDSGYILETKIESNADDFDMAFTEAALIYQVLYATHLKPEAIKDISELKSAVIIPVSKSDSLPETLSDTLTDKSEIQEPQIQNSKTQEIDEKPNTSEDPGTCTFQEITDISAEKDKQDIPDTVRIRVEILNKLMKLAGELVLVRNNLLTMTQTEHMYRGISQRLNLVTSEMQETIMQTRLQPIGNLFAKLPRIVRDLSIKLGKKIEIDVQGKEVELDKTILESLTDPMIHLIRNCCDHGIESPEVRKKSGKTIPGNISVHAWHDAGHIIIKIDDDGRGLDSESIKNEALLGGLKTAEELSGMSEKEIFSIILMSGFSTSQQVSDVSGRGVGMDVVRAGVERLGGAVELSSKKGQGTSVHLRLPLTLAIIPCLLIKVGDHRYAIPQTNLVELVCLRKQDVYTKIESAGDQEVYRLRDRLLPIVRLADVLDRHTPFSSADRAEISAAYGQISHEVINGQKEPDIKALNFAVVKIGAKRYGLVVDQVIGVEEIVVNPIHSTLKSLKIYAGTTIMGDGEVALILDIDGIAKHTDVQFNLREDEQSGQVFIGDETQTVLLFKSGPQEQFAVPLPMIRRIEHIRSSSIDHVGDKEFITVDGIPNRILRMDTVLNVSQCEQGDEMLLLLPKHIRRPFGILISEVVDTLQADLALNLDSHMEKGLLGTAVIDNHMTLFIDLYHLIELAEPEWFAERKKQAPPPEERKQILLLEDTPFFRNLVKGYLETDGYDVTAVENGQLGIAALKNRSFDIIVSDIDMPVMNGWAFMEYIRSENIAPDIPAMALTALDSEADRAKAAEVGFNAYQIKLDREELLTNVSKLLNQPRAAGKEAGR
ncbi:chemotaxis protein CheW [Desulfobacterales bacterium HSG17]|nr:chemotaxis protein CheW [Desulfobacterales bacterium HSG17]